MVDEPKLRRMLSFIATHYLTPAEVLDVMAQVSDGETGSTTTDDVVNLLMDMLEPN